MPSHDSPRSPGSPSSPEALARRMAADGQYAEAVACLERALEAEAGSDEKRNMAAALAAIARMAEAAGDPDTAERALECATHAADWADLHCQLGRLLVNRGRRVEARREFDRALTLNPRYRAAAVERALLDAREGRIGEATEMLRLLAAESAPSEPGAFQKGMQHLGEADFEDAAPLLRRALDLGDEWLDEQLRTYQDCVQRGEHEQALHMLRAAIAERPAYPDLHLLLGAHELQRGATDDALESLSRALELHPDYHAARVEFARALETLGDSPQAIHQLDLVLGQEPDHAGARGLRERLLARRRGARGRIPGVPKRA